MAFALVIPQPLKSQGWKVKIRDREFAEPPHVSVIRRTECWRIGLRDLEFMDTSPDPSRVPNDLVEFIHSKVEDLKAAWDRMYPHNPIDSSGSDDQ